MGVGGSVVQDHEDLEGEALRPEVLPKLVHQLGLGVCLENVARHPPTAVGIPVDGQAVLIVALKGTRVLSVVHQDGLELAVSRQVHPQQEGETILESLEAWARLLLLGDVRVFRHFLPLQARFIHVEDLLGLVTPLLDDDPEFVRIRSSDIDVSAFSLPRALDAMKGMTGLEIVKPAHAGYKIGYGARLLRLQVFIDFQDPLFGVVESHAQALPLAMVHPCD